METDNKQVSPADVQRAKDNEITAQKILDGVEKRKSDAKVSQDPILVNDATKGILERQGITNTITQEELDKREKDTKPNTVVNTIADAISKPAETELKQVDTVKVNDQSKEKVDITEVEFGALERAGITEEQILDSDGTLTQIKELAQTQLKKEQDEGTVIKPIETKPQDQTPMVISDAYAEQLALTYPFAKSLKGKTMEDVMSILSEQNRHISRLENSAGTVKDANGIDKNNSQIDNSDKDLSNDEVIDFLNLTPEEAGKKLKSLMKATADSVTSEKVATEIKKLLPNLEGLQTFSDEQIEKQFYNAVAEQLPNDTDAKKVVEDWKKVNVEMSNKSKKSLADNVELLITTITNDHKLGKLNSENTQLTKDFSSEVKSATFAKVRELIKKSKSLGVHNAQFNFKRKEVVDITGEPQNAGEELIGKIIERNLNRL